MLKTVPRDHTKNIPPALPHIPAFLSTEFHPIHPTDNNTIDHVCETCGGYGFDMKLATC
jgi:hypothetical protein